MCVCVHVYACVRACACGITEQTRKFELSDQIGNHLSVDFLNIKLI